MTSVNQRVKGFQRKVAKLGEKAPHPTDPQTLYFAREWLTDAPTLIAEGVALCHELETEACEDITIRDKAQSEAMAQLPEALRGTQAAADRLSLVLAGLIDEAATEARELNGKPSCSSQVASVSRLRWIDGACYRETRRADEGWENATLEPVLTTGSLIWHTRHDDAGFARDMASPIIRATGTTVTIRYKGEAVTLDRRKLETAGRADPSPRDKRGLPTFFTEPGGIQR